MGKKLGIPQWFKEAFASYRAMRAKGDLSPSEMYELLADDVQDRHKAGDPFGRSLWIDFIIGHDRSTKKTQADEAAEEWALAQARGLLQADLFPREVLEKLGLPASLHLGWDKWVSTPDARYADLEKYRDELERSKESWGKSTDKKIEAAERALALLPQDSSKTLRQIICDPEEYGYGAAAQ